MTDQRREFVLFGSAEGANVSALCRGFGISRQTGYKWLRRAAEGEVEFSDRSRRPRRQPARSAPELEAAVVAVRAAHPAWGARKIAWSLERDGVRPPAVSTVHAILCRHGCIGAASGAGRAYCRFERPGPNHLWQMDFKGRVPVAGRPGAGWCHPLTVLDDHSRYALCLEACADERASTVKPLLTRTFRRYGLPGALYLDNGSPWGGGVPGQWTPLGVWLLKLGIEVIHSRPYHPQGRGKNERFHRTLKAEVLAFGQFRDRAAMQARFDAWRGLYNMERPHEALGMAVPASRYQPSRRAMPRTLPEAGYGPGDILRKVGTTKAYISFKGRLWKLPQAFRGERVALRPRGTDGQYGVFFASTQIATIDLAK